MPESFLELVGGRTEHDVGTLLLKLVASAVLGIFIAVIHRSGTRNRLSDDFPFFVTIVLLPILVAMTTLVIADSIARAFGLVGALSIVRFRTVVEDTRDTAFIVFAVVTGMAVGSAHYLVCMTGVPVVAVVALGLDAWGRSRTVRGHPLRMTVRVVLGLEAAPLLAAAFSRHLIAHRMVGVATVKQGAAIDHRFLVVLGEGTDAGRLVGDINALEGVQSVEIGES